MFQKGAKSEYRSGPIQSSEISGPANPFTVLYLVQITLSAVVLSRAWTWTLGLLSISGFASLFLAHVPVSILEAHHAGDGLSVHLLGMWIAFAVGALLITVFIGQVSQALRRREQEVLQLRDRLARHERLTSIATLAAGAAHELGTPLATIAIASRELELYAKQISKDGSVAEDARLIRSEVERCNGILRHMRGREVEPAGETPSPVWLTEITERVKCEFSARNSALIQTEVPEDERAVLPVDATHQALIALVKNAIDASATGRPVRLSVKCLGGRICFTIQDHGSGMDAETLNRVSEPFFTTKGPGRGMGLGTFLVRAFAENLGGSLIFESEVGFGTTAILELPLYRHVGERETSCAHR
jgi:two-component system sensor histidine kinase RegB